MNSDGAFTIV
jgi:Calcineurin-like phosphoesterase